MESSLAVLCGDSTLVIDCAKQLLGKGVKVMAIISSDDSVVAWSKEIEGCQYFSSLGQAQHFLETTHYDFFFSIYNRCIVPNQIIKKAKRYAINLHNSLLPCYGGVNPLSWALTKGEKTHGVTWHVMTEEIDGGDILLQKEVKVAPLDTVYTLHLKCYKEALQLFKMLVDQLADNQINPIKQLNETRCYFSSKDIFPDYGMIQWGDSCDQVRRLFRSCQFGPIDNYWGLPKVFIGNKVYVASQLKVKESIGEDPAGTLIASEPGALKIRIQDGVLCIYRLWDGVKEIRSLSEFAAQLGLSEGERLPAVPQVVLDQLEGYARTLAVKERAWIERLSDYEPYYPDYLEHVALADSHEEVAVVDLSDACRHPLSEQASSRAILMGICSSFIYKYFDCENKSVLFSNDMLRIIHRETSGVFSSHVPINFSYSEHDGLEQIVDHIAALLDVVEKQKTFSLDVMQRYAHLKNKPLASPISIELCDVFDVEAFKNCCMSKIRFIIDMSTRKVHVLLSQHAPQYLKDLIIKMSQYLDYYQSEVGKRPDQEILQWQFFDINNVSVESAESLAPGPVKLLKDFVATASTDGEKTAVFDGQSSWTYGHLSSEVRRFTEFLVLQGVHEGSVVAVNLNPSTSFLVAVLSIFNLGATYLPIDITTPALRRQRIINMCRPALIIAEDAVIADIRHQCSEKVVSALEYQKVIGQVEYVQCRTVKPTTSAYIVFTSGTTGEPKGVEVSYGSLKHSLDTRIAYYAHEKHECVLTISSIGFDVYTSGLLWPLLSNASLCLIKEKAYDPYQIVRNKNLSKVTCIICVPTLYKSLLKRFENKAPALRSIILGGECISQDLLEKHFAKFPSVSIHNEYGPTETTVWTSVKTITRSDVVEKLPVSIGNAIQGSALLLLDKHMSPVGFGMQGELYVAGPNVTKGYFQDKVETGKVFLPAPDWFSGTDKIYKTGDYAYRLASGEFVFCRRKDSLVKFHGYRIDVAEIEKCLLVQNIVKQAWAVVSQGNGVDSITAYVLLSDAGIKNSNRSACGQMLKQELKKVLPAYMVPHHIVVLDEYPVTVNGKLDHEKLPPPQEMMSDLLSFREQNSKIESARSIWRQVLMVPEVEEHDNFFDLGGDSIGLSRLATISVRVLGVQLSLEEFLSNPTLRNYIALIFDQSSELNGVDSQTQRIINEDLVFPMEVRPSIKRKFRLGKIENILLTGATGFVGSNFLHLLCCETNAKLYCLIRADSIKHAKAKLKKALEKNGLSSSCADNSRLEIVLGDLSENRLGLTGAAFDRLAKTVDVIYHFGAYVNHIYGYRKLRAANVSGTLELIKLASKYRRTAIHYLSTLSAAVERDGFGFLKEELVSDVSIYPRGGYAVSKWAAEKLLADASLRGVPVTIYRPTWIVGRSDTGEWNFRDDHVMRLLSGCIQMGVAPDWNVALNMIPVDYLCQLIAAVSFDVENDASVFNITHNRSQVWKNLITRLSDQIEGGVQLIDPDEWIQVHLSEIDMGNPIFPLLPIYLKKYANSKHTSGTESLASILDTKPVGVRDSNTRQFLARHQLELPSLEDDFLGKYFCVEKLLDMKYRNYDSVE